MRGYGRDGVVDKIRASGGEIYAITSEPQRLASQARSEWELDFETIGDPHHEISTACRERGLLEIYVNTETRLMSPDENSPYSHPKGYFQPGVLSLDSKGRVLYRWRGTPTRRNMGGATERPTAGHVFENVSRALAESTATHAPADAELDTNPKLDSRGIPWPIFVSLLVANGWFVKPKPFPYLSDGPSVEKRAKRALVRIPIFVAAWSIALTQLPTLWVATAFAGWAVWLTPQIRFINRQFQNLSPQD